MPLRNQIHVDKLLTNVSVKYSNAEYIADAATQKVNVKKTSDLYQVWDRNFRIPETARANGGLAREHDFDMSTASYNLEKHALKGYITPDDKDNYDIGDLRVDLTEELTDKIMARKELSYASLFTASSWSLNVSLAAANAFSADTTVSNPIPVFDTGVSTVIANSGRKPNYAVIPHNTLVAIKNHQSVLDRVKYTSREMNKAIIGGLIGISEIHEPIAQRDTSARGVASNLESIFPQDKVFLGYKPPRPSPKQPASIYQFFKAGQGVRRWNDKEREDSEVVEVQQQFQFRIVASLTGYLINDTI